MKESAELESRDPGEEIVLDDIIDLEEFAKRGERPPLAKGYRMRINGESYVIHDPKPTGREVLTLGGLLPAEEYTLRVKRPGEKPEKVGLDEVVDLRKRGVEKFKALPRDQTEG
ncbi:multiubiquitin domain-containing protein [Pyruvatibacter mobilis]|uniref:multiubiquitin domain-containing protein n=1 Tax=Pyruvatibacter mobilis TaxID=1712261 RepID=UPI003C7BC3BA